MPASLPAVFLSYARADAGLARRIEADLRARGEVDVLSDSEVAVGQDWQGRLRDAMRRAAAVVVLLTPEGAASDWLRWEVGAAWGMGKQLVIVTRHPGLVARLPELSRYRVVDPDDPGALDAIAEAVQKSAA